LQLAVRVKETRAHSALGNPEDFADFGVWHTLDIKHGDYGSVFIRQLHHSLVQSLLKLFEIHFSSGVRARSHFNEVWVLMDPVIDVIKAHIVGTGPLFQEVDRHVGGDRMEPGVEAGFTPETFDRAVGLGKDVL